MGKQDPKTGQKLLFELLYSSLQMSQGSYHQARGRAPLVMVISDAIVAH